MTPPAPDSYGNTPHATPHAASGGPERSADIAPGDTRVAVLELDLNGQLQFATGRLVLTRQQVIVHFSESNNTPSQRHAWDRSDRIAIGFDEFAGIGWLRLMDGQKLLAQWPVTARKFPAARRLVESFERTRQATDSRQGDSPAASGACDSCGAILEHGSTECEICNPREAPPPTRSLLRLAAFARRRKTSLSLGFLLTLLATAFGLVPPYLTMPLMDRVLIPWQQGETVPGSTAAIYLGTLLLAAFVAWGLGWARTYVMSYFSEKISADLRDTTYAHLQRLSLEFFGGKRTGDLISRIGSDTDRICMFLSVHLLDFSTDVVMIVMTSVILLSIHPLLACATLIPLPAVFWLVQLVRKRLRHGFARAGHAWGEMVSVLADSIPGIRVVKAFAQEQREIDRFAAVNQRVMDFNMRVNRLWSFFGPTVSLLTEIGVLVIWGVGAWLVSKGQVTVGVLTAFFAYMSRFYTRLDSMSRILASTQRAAAATYRVFEILDRKSSVPEAANPVVPTRLQGAIRVEHVGFRYGTRTILDDISLTINPGELIGLVGPSGSGKSTLVNLVCRFYDVSAGNIAVDGVDIRSYAIEPYRKNLGLVLQDPFLFFGTIAENIAYGRSDATRAEIVAAARAAHAHEFIMRLPDAYDSLVGERGQSLSGGERQRISIARALLTDPRILILDEATSAVDNETEREIQAALENLIRGRTTIAIAHRLSTLRNADRIIVLDQGRVVEVGKHAELLALGGVYARLHKAQFAEERRTESDEGVDLDSLRKELPV